MRKVRRGKKDWDAERRREGELGEAVSNTADLMEGRWREEGREEARRKEER